MNLIFERRAEIALRSLRGIDQKRVQRALQELRVLEPREVTSHQRVHRLAGSQSEPLYVYNTAKRLRLVFTIDAEDCRLIDIVDRDRLDRLRQDRRQG